MLRAALVSGVVDMVDDDLVNGGGGRKNEKP